MRHLHFQKPSVTFFAAIALLLYMIPLNLTANACDPQWLKGVYDCGKVLQLDDGSIWKVHALSQVRATQWKMGENVVICAEERKMKNVDKPTAEQEWIFVNRLTRYAPPKKSSTCMP